MASLPRWGLLPLLLSSSLLLNLSNSFLFRAILASTDPQSKLNQDFIKAISQQQPSLLVEEIESGQIVFAANNATASTTSTGTTTGSHRDDSCVPSSGILSFLYYLPISKVRIVVSGWNLENCKNVFLPDENAEVDHGGIIKAEEAISDSSPQMISQIETAMSLWTSLGNSLQAVDSGHDSESCIGFSLTTSSTRTSSRTMRQGRRRQGKHKPRDNFKEITSCVAKLIESEFGWKRVARQPSLAFHLVEVAENHYSLELTVLARTYPLRDRDDSSEESSHEVATTATSKKKNRNSTKQRRYEQKRIESFLVARAANIQQGEHILDPMCGRATILIEAAKYWPLAGAYYGVDTSIPHLEHAVMNADSTKTCLDLRWGKPFELPHKENSLDKIVTCLPFRKSVNYYYGLLREWSRVLKHSTGKMILVIDQPTLPDLTAAINSLDYLDIEFVRSTFLWGTDRVTIVIVGTGVSQNTIGSSPTSEQGIFDWERSGKTAGDSQTETSLILDRQNWLRLRATTRPPLVPYTQVQRANSCSNTFIVPPALKQVD